MKSKEFVLSDSEKNLILEKRKEERNDLLRREWEREANKRFVKIMYPFDYPLDRL